MITNTVEFKTGRYDKLLTTDSSVVPVLLLFNNKKILRWLVELHPPISRKTTLYFYLNDGSSRVYEVGMEECNNIAQFIYDRLDYVMDFEAYLNTSYGLLTVSRIGEDFKIKLMDWEMTLESI